MSVAAQADGYHTVTPLFHVADVPTLIAFLQVAFGAEETQRTTDNGMVVHAEVRIGDSRVMLGEPWGGTQLAPRTHHAYLYVEDVDAKYERALSCGATSIMGPSDMNWGDRLAGIQDPAGIIWWIATQKTVVLPPPARAW